jgi:hypothetical protein
MVERVETVIGLPRCRLWLDVGFGNGSLLMTAQEFGFQPFGIDLRKQNVDDLIGLGIPAYHGSLAGAVSDSALPTPPTVISMADVVEHVPFPREPLRHARALIADGGILLVSMPNANSKAPSWSPCSVAKVPRMAAMCDCSARLPLSRAISRPRRRAASERAGRGCATPPRARRWTPTAICGRTLTSPPARQSVL